MDTESETDDRTTTVRRLGGTGLLLTVAGALLLSLPTFLVALPGVVLVGAGLVLLAAAASVHLAGRPGPPVALRFAVVLWLAGTIAIFAGTRRGRSLVPVGALAVALSGYPLGVCLRRRRPTWAAFTVFLAVVATGVTAVLQTSPFPMGPVLGVLVFGGLPALPLFALGWLLGRGGQPASGA
ncbi:hypothetical protein ACOZ4L_10145 [Haloplanus ruber]|uniref:Uncharacterized protein n=1 Tax=Haloplanus ruber TaxID=869892 RepID=A0ABD6CY07_9EURY|nr:hypothetical protein [Haloplanus ruber]